MIIVSGLISYEPLTYEDYVYPMWANVFGMLLAASSVFCIPGIAVWKLVTTPGTCSQVYLYILHLINVQKLRHSNTTLISAFNP